MKRGIILLLALFALTAAMVPRDRRAVNTEEEEERLRSQNPAPTAKQEEICAPQTPCAWSIYKPTIKIIEMNITNTYCKCSPDTICQMLEDDTSVNAYVHRCRPPSFKSDLES